MPVPKQRSAQWYPPGDRGSGRLIYQNIFTFFSPHLQINNEGPTKLEAGTMLTGSTVKLLKYNIKKNNQTKKFSLFSVNLTFRVFHYEKLQSSDIPGQTVIAGDTARLYFR